MNNLGKFEKIKYDFETRQFYIAVRTTDGTEERKNLDAWGLVKAIDVSVIVKKNVSTIGKLEQDVTPEFYNVPISYRIEPKAKTIYLKIEKQKQEDGSVIARVFRKDVDAGYAQVCPLPNALYNGEFEKDLIIKRGKGKLISSKVAAQILKSGTCLGLYNQEMTNRLISV